MLGEKRGLVTFILYSSIPSLHYSSIPFLRFIPVFEHKTIPQQLLHRLLLY